MAPTFSTDPEPVTVTVAPALPPTERPPPKSVAVSFEVAVAPFETVRLAVPVPPMSMPPTVSSELALVTVTDP